LIEIRFKSDDDGKDSKQISSEFVYRLNDPTDNSITALGLQAGTVAVAQPLNPQAPILNNANLIFLNAFVLFVALLFSF
jgi:hypothetical protein